MNSAYEVLRSIRGYMKNAGTLITTMPNRANADRHDVDTADNRGGFQHTVFVPTGENQKARLLVNFIDTKVRDHENDRFGYAFQCIADYDGTRFSYVNSAFDAMLSRALYEQLVAIGVCQEDADLRHLVRLNLAHLPVFPRQTPDLDYAVDKQQLVRLKAYYKNLKDLQKAARKWYKDNDILEFRGLEPFQTRTKTDNVAILIPYFRYNMELQGEVEPIPFDKKTYRIETMQGKRVRVEYPPRLYRALRAEILRTKRQIDALASSVRVRELSYLEHQPFEGVVSVGGSRFIKNILPENDTQYVNIVEAEEYIRQNPQARFAKAFEPFAPAA